MFSWLVHLSFHEIAQALFVHSAVVSDIIYEDTSFLSQILQCLMRPFPHSQ